MTAADSGLGAYLSYSTTMASSCQDGVNNLDTTIGALEAQDWSGEPVEALGRAKEALAAAASAFSDAHDAFQRALAVADAYAANDHAGTKESVLGNTHGPETGTPSSTSGYNPERTGFAGQLDPTTPTPGNPVMDNTEPALPEEANQMTCPNCGGPTYQHPTFKIEVSEDNGRMGVSLHCENACGWNGRVFGWTVTPDEYEAIFGHPLVGLEPAPPQDRVLPPGPWGVYKVEPSPIPDEAWSLKCTKRRCGAYLNPHPEHVFYYDEFTSTVTVGLGRCPRCNEISLAYYTWPLTPDRHHDIFGRSQGEYRPDYDPTDPDDFEAEYSMWRTTDRGLLTHFRDINHLGQGEDYDLRQIGPGEFTIKHWPTGAVWDVPDFVAQHENVVAAAKDDEDVSAEDDEGE